MKNKAITAEQMAEIDRLSQSDFGINQLTLMENAGKAVAEEIISDLDEAASCRIALLCGKGNNGGDGFVAARYLFEHTSCEVMLYAADEHVKEGAAAENFERARSIGLSIMPLSSFISTAASHEIVVDALLGTGSKGQLSVAFSEVCAVLNSVLAKIYAVDVPSGLDATTGFASKETPKAYKTITFGLAKTGFYLNDGPGLCGEIIVKDIGFPPELIQKYAA